MNAYKVVYTIYDLAKKLNKSYAQARTLIHRYQIPESFKSLAGKSFYTEQDLSPLFDILEQNSAVQMYLSRRKWEASKKRKKIIIGTAHQFSVLVGKEFLKVMSLLDTKNIAPYAESPNGKRIYYLKKDVEPILDLLKKEKRVEEDIDKNIRESEPGNGYRLTL